MGLATIDSHSQKERTEIHKIPKFRVNQASFDWDTAILKTSKLTKKCMDIRTPAIHLFGNFEIFEWLYLT